MTKETKAVVLLSGGIDSTVVLALALSQNRHCTAISFDYSQKNRVELKAAESIAQYYNTPHRIIMIDPAAFINSSLVGSIKPPEKRNTEKMSTEGIPNTFVPARNTIFLSYAMGIAELIEAKEIHFGANCVDHLCYPDCRPAYIEAFQGLLNVANQNGVDGNPIQLNTPLLYLNKKEIIRKGRTLKAPLDLTISCYQPLSLKEPCEICDACIIRNEGFNSL
jgi:7-cyano-7-deazaguanine synthase